MEQSAWVSVPDPGSVLHAHTKSEKGTSKPFLRSNRLGSRCLTQVRCYMLTLNQKKVPQNPPFGAIGLGLGARPRFGVTCHAKSEKGTSKPFLRSSRSGPPTLYAFAILRIQTWISFYVAPLIWGGQVAAHRANHYDNSRGRLLSALPTHRFIKSGAGLLSALSIHRFAGLGDRSSPLSPTCCFSGSRARLSPVSLIRCFSSSGAAPSPASLSHYFVASRVAPPCASLTHCFAGSGDRSSPLSSTRCFSSSGAGLSPVSPTRCFSSSGVASSPASLSHYFFALEVAPPCASLTRCFAGVRKMDPEPFGLIDFGV
jgi:hypothetical protein